MGLFQSIKRDIKAARQRDPAATSDLEVVLTYPGFHARQVHRLAHSLHRRGFRVPARLVSHFGRAVTGIEIHPVAHIGEGFFIDHGMGVVIGETAIIKDNVHLFQGVTLGGTSTRRAKRHPTLNPNVVVGAGAKVIGDVTIGENAKIGAGSVVVTNVPAHATVVGVPGHIVAFADPGDDTVLRLPDPEWDIIKSLECRIAELEFHGFKVKHVQNYTDIDDKLIMRANAQGVPVSQLSTRYIEEFDQEMRELNITPAHLFPRATQEIPTIIEMIEGLVEKGHAYQANGDVYFRVRSKSDYGKLSGRDVDSLRAGARVEPGEQKEDPADFALWKGAKPGEPSWDSPWGNGRPGWHIECSAMSYRYLGATLDIHGGGQDLIFPHHENEIAQSEAYSSTQPFVRYWLHNGWLTFGEEKRSKSLGNIITSREGLERYGTDGIRLFVLTSHYRAPLTYSGEALESGKRAAERLRLAATLPGGEGPAADIEVEGFRERFVVAMDDDLNTPAGLAALFDLAREIT